MFGGADKEIGRLVRGKGSLSRGMNRLLDFCCQSRSSPAWEKLRDLDYAADQKEMSHWLSQLLDRKPPPKRINGIWFGLFNRTLDDGRSTCCMHLAGSSRFDPDEPALNCFSEPQYLPAQNSTNSRVLTSIVCTIGQFPKVASLGEYTLCLGYACLLVRDWCRGAIRAKLLGDAPRRGVAVGFDSGDGMVVDILE